MGGRCGFRGRRNPNKPAGIVLMAVGALLFLVFVPRWFWMSALGIVLISVGYLLWRFSD